MVTPTPAQAPDPPNTPPDPPPAFPHQWWAPEPSRTALWSTGPKTQGKHQPVPVDVDALGQVGNRWTISPLSALRGVHLAWVHVEKSVLGLGPHWGECFWPGYMLRGVNLAWVHTEKCKLGPGSHLREVNFSWVHTARIELGLGSPWGECTWPGFSWMHMGPYSSRGAPLCSLSLWASVTVPVFCSWAGHSRSCIAPWLQMVRKVE